MREDAEASWEHGKREGLKTPRGGYQEATEPPGLGLRVVEAGDRCRNQGHEVGVKRRPALRNQPKDICILYQQGKIWAAGNKIQTGTR